MKVSDDKVAQELLFGRYATWARSIARGVHRRVWAYPVDCDDFVQNAHIGLLEAMRRFDPARGIPFQAFATPRVRGAVFNGLRAILGERPRPQDATRFAARLDALQFGADGNDVFDDMVDVIVGLGVGFMLDDAIHSTGSQSTNDGLAFVQTAEMQLILSAAVDQLPERLRYIIHSHYFLFVPFHEIAETLDLTKGRISQLHKSALAMIRDSLCRYDVPT